VNKPQIVIDTSAFISALLSQRGAAYQLLMLAGSGLFEVNLSVPLVAEYETVARRMLNQTQLVEQDSGRYLGLHLHCCQQEANLLFVASISARFRG